MAVVGGASGVGGRRAGVRWGSGLLVVEGGGLGRSHLVVGSFVVGVEVGRRIVLVRREVGLVALGLRSGMRRGRVRRARSRPFWLFDVAIGRSWR